VRRALNSLLLASFCAYAGTAPLLAQTAPQGHVFAAPQSSAPLTAPSFSGLGQVTLALLLVLTAVFVVAWLVRRMRTFGNRVGSALDVLAEIPLGQKERAVLLKVGQTQILVGVAPGQVSTLHVLAEPIQLSKTPESGGEGRPNFKALMLRSLGK
jgi:flagellar protein FliO/FliZ